MRKLDYEKLSSPAIQGERSVARRARGAEFVATAERLAINSVRAIGTATKNHYGNVVRQRLYYGGAEEVDFFPGRRSKPDGAMDDLCYAMLFSVPPLFTGIALLVGTGISLGFIAGALAISIPCLYVASRKFARLCFTDYSRSL